MAAYGDRATLDTLHYLDTETIDLTGLKNTFTTNAGLVHASNISVATDMVLVTVEIEPVNTAEFSRDIIFAENVAAGLECILPSLSLQVVVSGPDTYINQVVAGDIVPYVDCSGIVEPGEYTLPLRFNLPPNIALVESSPDEVTVQIKAMEDATDETAGANSTDTAEQT
jgi:YbbR domain-containing protein